MGTVLPKVGDRIRASSTGVVLRIVESPNGRGHTRIAIRRPSGKSANVFIHPAGVDNPDIEILEQEYEDEGVYVDKDGDVFQYTKVSNGWYCFGSDELMMLSGPTRPLRRVDVAPPEPSVDRDRQDRLERALERALDDGMPG